MAEVLVNICCHPRREEKDQPTRDADSIEAWPLRAIADLPSLIVPDDLLGREDAIAALTTAQTMCETLMRLKSYDEHGLDVSPGLNLVIRELIDLQTRVFDLYKHPKDVFGVRCAMRYSVIILDQRAIVAFQPSGIPLMGWDLEEMRNICRTATTNADHELLSHANKRLSPDDTYRVTGYSHTQVEVRRSEVELALRLAPEQMPSPGDLLADTSPRKDQASESTSDVANKDASIARYPTWTSIIPQRDLSQRCGSPTASFDQEYDQLKRQWEPLHLRLLATRASATTEQGESLNSLLDEARVSVDRIQAIERRYWGRGLEYPSNPSLIQRSRWNLYDRARLQRLVESLDETMTRIESLSPPSAKKPAEEAGPSEDLDGRDIHARDVHANEVHAVEIHATRIYATEVYATEIHAATVRAANVQANEISSAEAQVSDAFVRSSPQNGTLAWKVFYSTVTAVQAKEAYHRLYISVAAGFPSARDSWRRLVAYTIFDNERKRLTTAMGLYRADLQRNPGVPKKGSPQYATKGMIVKDTKAALSRLDRYRDRSEQSSSSKAGSCQREQMTRVRDTKASVCQRMHAVMMTSKRAVVGKKTEHTYCLRK